MSHAKHTKPVLVFDRRIAILGVAAIFFTICCAHALSEERKRVWSDKSGKFKLEAEYQGIEEGKVLLKKTGDGKVVRVPLGSLNPADAKIANDFAAEDAENPFAGGEDPVPKKNDLVGSKLIEAPKRASIESIPLAAFDRWEYKPDPEVAVENKFADSTPLPKPKRADKDPQKQQFAFHDRMDDGLFVFGRSEYLATVRNPFLDRDGGKPLLARFDLATGKPKPAKPLPFATNIRFASPDGKLLVGWNEEDRERIDLHVMSLDEQGALSLLYRWQPLAKDEHWDFMNEIKFLANDRVLVRSTKGPIDVWEINDKSAKVLYSIAAEPHGSGWGISRGGKYLAVTTKDSVHILEAADGKIVGRIAASEPGQTSVSFSYDGERLATSSGLSLTVYDLATQKPAARMRFQNAIQPGEIEWPAPDHLLLGGRHLVNLPLQAITWEYRNNGWAHSAPHYFGGAYWYRTTGTSDAVLVRAKLPHQAALDVVKAIDPAKLYILKPGAEVALVVKEDGPERDAIIRGVTENLRKVGITVVPSADMAFICETEVGQAKPVPYRLFGGGQQTVNVTEKTHRIKLMEGQNLRWEAASHHAAPFFINLNDGETIEQHVANAMNTSKGYFLGIPVPATVVRYPDNQTSLGASDLKPTGP